MANPISHREFANAVTCASLVAAAFIVPTLVGAIGPVAASRESQGVSTTSQSTAPDSRDTTAPESRRTTGASDPSSPDERARATEARMTDDERFSLLISILGNVPGGALAPDPRVRHVKNQSAGYTPGIPRLGIPTLQSSDASMGITNPGYRPDDKGATAFPASIVVGSSFNPQLAREGGAAIAREARSRGSTSSWPAA